ncbi:hypothetical protein HYS79_02340 [Patescibacteria group bacterium]|nr:hypothetical protein [Patescibacteria group bacterium]
MTKKYVGLFGVTAGVFLFAGVVFAQEGTVIFPIAELGGCTSKAECKTYCDQPDNRDACIAFAEEHNLMQKDEIAAARSFVKKVQNGEGPGGCATKSECQNYCAQAEHRKECVAFALENGLRPPPAAEQHRQNENQSKIVRILRETTGPGGCTTQGECKTYCSAEENHEECVQFAKDYDLMSAKEAEHARALVGKLGPGDCRGEECKVYCAKEENREECVAFALKNGLITKERADREENLRTMEGPGGCQGIAACREYCANPEHQGECRAFAQEHNLGGVGTTTKVRPVQPMLPDFPKRALPLRPNMMGSTTRQIPPPSIMHQGKPENAGFQPQLPKKVLPGQNPFFQTKERENLKPATTSNLGASVISALQLFLKF